MEAIEHRFSVMHSSALIVLYPDTSYSASQVQEALAKAEARARDYERIFTRFNATSELCRLNAASGKWVDVSAPMAAVLEIALRMHRATGGVFDPAILPDLELAGYDRTFEDLDADAQRRDVTRDPRGSFGDLEIEGRRVRFPAGVRIDLGGIVKGWTADLLADHLYEVGPVLVELGGDIAVRGTPIGGEQWQVGVEAPGKNGELLAILVIESGALATSGTERMRWRVNGEWAHHLIDPKTGEPARSDLLQVTALGYRAAETEVWAKTALIVGTAASGALVAQHPGLELLLVPTEGPAVGTPGMIAAASFQTDRP